MKSPNPQQAQKAYYPNSPAYNLANQQNYYSPGTMVIPSPAYQYGTDANLEGREQDPNMSVLMSDEDEELESDDDGEEG